MEIRLEDIRKLPLAERIRLVGDIWDSIAEDSEKLPLTDAQAEDLDRRLAEYEADPSATRTWDEVREDLDRYE